MGTSKTPVLKLDRISPSIQQEIVKRRLTPYVWSWEKISEWLKSTYGIEASHVTIGKWLERKEAVVTQSIYGDPEFQSGASKVYGEVLGEYFSCLKTLTKLMKETARSKKIDDISKVECCKKLFDSIRDGTIAAKDLIVGANGTEAQIVNIEEELEQAMEDLPMIRIIGEEG